MYNWVSVFLRDHGFPQIAEVVFHPELISGDVFIGPPPPQVVQLYGEGGLEGGTGREVTCRQGGLGGQGGQPGAARGTALHLGGSDKLSQHWKAQTSVVFASLG